jgi:hypothetical protein
MLFKRFTVWDREHGDRTPYQTRVTLGALRLHIFHRADRDPDWHDHPWWFITFPFHSYVEQVLSPVVHEEVVGNGNSEWTVFDDDNGLHFHSSEIQYVRLQIVRRFRFHYRPSTHAHRIVGRFAGFTAAGYPLFVPDEKIVTLVWRGPKVREWGFIRRSRLGRWCWEHWQSYHGPNREPACHD